jgi:hypothetical protein
MLWGMGSRFFILRLAKETEFLVLSSFSGEDRDQAENGKEGKIGQFIELIHKA